MQGICSVCEGHKEVLLNSKTEKLICPNCYRRDPSTHEECSKCGEVKQIHARFNGKPICQNCYMHDRSGHKKCSVCGEVRAVAKRTVSDEPICVRCYPAARYRDPSTHEKCSKCGEVKPVATRIASGKPLCQMCYKRSKVAKVTVTVSA